MIHWDWVATATVATPCVMFAFWIAATVGSEIEDRLDAWSNRRAIEREKRAQAARMSEWPGGYRG